MSAVNILKISSGKPKKLNPLTDTVQFDAGFQVGHADGSAGTKLSIVAASGDAADAVMLSVNSVFQFRKDGSASLGASGKTVTFTGDVSVTGTYTIVGGTTFQGDVDLGDASTDLISFVGSVDTSIVPNTAGAVDFGTTTKEWRAIYLSQGADSGAYIGSGQEGRLWYDNTNTRTTLTVNNLRVGLGDAVGANSFVIVDSAGETQFSVNTSGAAVVQNTLGVTGDFAVATNKFNVTASSGNTSVAGTLGVTGLTTATGGVKIIDDVALIFGTDSNATLTYDEITNDRMEAVGTWNWQGAQSYASTMTLSANSATITHSGTTSLIIASTSGFVGVESIQFDGTDIGLSGDTDLLQVAANSLTVNGDVTAASSNFKGNKLRLNESTAPTHTANKGFVYAKDVTGITELFYGDSDGATTLREIQITSNGELNIGAISFSLQQAYNDGATIALSDSIGDLAITLDETGTPADFTVTGATLNYVSTDVSATRVTLGDPTGVSVYVAGNLNGPADTVSFLNDAAKTLNVAAAATSTAGRGLTVAAGSATGPGDFAGGNLTLNAGSKSGTGSAGQVLVGEGNTSTVKVCNATGNPTFVQLGSGQVTFNGNVDAVSGLDVTGNITQGTGTFSLSGNGDSSLTVTAANLSISTATSGELDLTSAGLMDVNAGNNLDIDVTGSFDMLSSGAFSIDGTGASNVTATSGNLTVSTATSGTLAVTSVATLDMDGVTVTLDASNGFSIDGSGAASNLSSTSQNLTVSTLTSGTLFLTSAGALDMDGTNITVDATGTLSLDATGSTNLTVAANSVDSVTLTIASGNSGAGSAIIDVDAKGAFTLDAGMFSLDGAMAPSNVTSTGQNLTISTLTSGTLVLDSVALIDMNAGANLDIDVTGTVDILATSTFSIDGTGASNVSTTAGALTISTITSGLLELTGADGISVNSAVTFDGNLSFAAQTQTVNDIQVRDLASKTISYTNNTGVEIAAFSVVAADTTGGQIVLADASAIATCRVLGVAAAAIADAASGRVWVQDGLEVTNGSWNWTVGSPVYVSETGGALTQTAPSTTDSVVYQVGIATAATKIQVQLQFVYEN